MSGENSIEHAHFIPPRADSIGSQDSVSVAQYLEFVRAQKLRTIQAEDDISEIFSKELKGYQHPVLQINVREAMACILGEVTVEDIEEGIKTYELRGIDHCIEFFLNLL